MIDKLFAGTKIKDIVAEELSGLYVATLNYEGEDDEEFYFKPQEKETPEEAAERIALKSYEPDWINIFTKEVPKVDADKILDSQVSK